MLKYLVNNKNKDNNEVLLKPPLYKSYVTGITKPQSAQKGPTCWYYAFNHIRVRYGKNVSIKDCERRNEAILSDYRKVQTLIDNYAEFLRELNSSLRKDYNTKHITKSMVIFRRYEDEAKAPLFQKNIEIYDHFLKQTKFDFFKDFIEDKIVQERIRNAEITLNKFNYLFPKVILESYISFLNDGPVDLNHCTDEVIASCYDSLLYKLAAEKYHFMTSRWHPKDSIQVLINELRSHGAMVVAGYIGTPFYTKNKAIFVNSFENQPIFFLPETAYKSTPKDTSFHSVIVMGAKKHGVHEYVYFMDPNENSDKRNIYAVSYDFFKTKIADVYGLKNSMNNPLSKNPFGFHGNHKWINEETKFFRKESSYKI